MTPSSLAAAARRLGGNELRRSSSSHAWWLYGAGGTVRVIGTNNDLCMALLEAMPFPSLRMAAIPAGGHDWECELQNAGPCEYGDTPLEAVLACVEAMEGKQHG
jgi:hypothetical protein